VLREIEEMSTAESAAVRDPVETRLNRARALLRRALYAGTRQAAHEVFQFGFARCDRVVAAVLGRIGQAQGAASG